jgi:hypothetical protein
MVGPSLPMERPAKIEIIPPMNFIMRVESQGLLK